MKEDLAGLDLIELLDRLEPLAEPAPISLWPQTEAWAWVGLAVLLGLIWLARRGMVRRRARAYRRMALAEIAAARSSPATIAEILRRTALVAYPRSEVAGLYGDDWLAFLDKTGPLPRSGLATNFREGPGRCLARAPYSRTSEAVQDDHRQMVALANRWVRHHRSAAGGPS